MLTRSSERILNPMRYTGKSLSMVVLFFNIAQVDWGVISHLPHPSPSTGLLSWTAELNFFMLRKYTLWCSRQSEAWLPWTLHLSKFLSHYKYTKNTLILVYIICIYLCMYNIHIFLYTFTYISILASLYTTANKQICNQRYPDIFKFASREKIRN